MKEDMQEGKKEEGRAFDYFGGRKEGGHEGRGKEELLTILVEGRKEDMKIGGRKIF